MLESTSNDQMTLFQSTFTRWLQYFCQSHFTQNTSHSWNQCIYIKISMRIHISGPISKMPWVLLMAVTSLQHPLPKITPHIIIRKDSCHKTVSLPVI
ncbi:hypothetical protein ID866_11865 [Astraeus odoratus]|nr:hypothetical protein ID866_11865 [Astraeus odoratus]